ncbi:MAG: copper homeostasis protein CutC [Phaeodactylibacter sp.]|nr:copper homeostasis protein CutC [Phaeodactylibacter sp.]MCB9293343.1 copper homeostasis protein CutC [Lewinellaceae bacterium]
MPYTLEICCDSAASAIAAARGGAHRIELCENLAQGGVTPSAAKIKIVKAQLAIPVFVLIRPRKADFLYSGLEFEVMLEDIRQAKALGADGIVSGALHADGTIDEGRTRQMVETAAPLPFTFHRAFDMCRDPLAAIDLLAGLGVKRILTSGQQPTALEGRANIERYVKHAGGRIGIMACGELLPDNIGALLSIRGLTEFHSAARKEVKSRMAYTGGVNMGDEAVQEEFRWQEVDERLVSGMKNVLDQY